MDNDTAMVAQCRDCRYWHQQHPTDTHGQCMHLFNIARAESHIYLTGPYAFCTKFEERIYAKKYPSS